MPAEPGGNGGGGRPGARDVMARVLSHPRVYKVQRRVLGAERLDRRLAPFVATAVRGRREGTVVDVGGGTGASRSLWPDAWTYVSIDPDERAVTFGHVEGRTERTVGSASDLPFPDDFADAVLMKEVSHHLDERTWETTLTEVQRILKPGGTFVFLDGVWTPRRWASRLVWRFDVGRFPRERARLEADIARHFDVESVAGFAAIHRCIVLVGRPRSPRTVGER